MEHQLRYRLPKLAIRVGRHLRNWAYALLEPFDYVARAINNKTDLPPLRLRRAVGDLRSFEGSGAEFMAYLRLLCNLQPHERILDIGSGCGLMALFLLGYLDAEATYAGIDVHRPSVAWCKRNITPKNRRFVFEHVNLKNEVYNPIGLHSAADYSFPFGDSSFDLILAKSVFTHLRPPALDNFLKEIARLLSAKGRCLATFFLLNEMQRQLAEKGLNHLPFRFGDDTWRYAYQNSAESAVAYGENFLLSLLAKHDLQLARPIIYGTWSGRKDGLSYQDMLLLRNRGSDWPAGEA